MSKKTQSQADSNLDSLSIPSSAEQFSSEKTGTVSPAQGHSGTDTSQKNDANPKNNAKTADCVDAQTSAPEKSATGPMKSDAPVSSPEPKSDAADLSGASASEAPKEAGKDGEEEDLSLYETSAQEAGLELCGSDINSEDFVHPADRAEHLEQLPLNKQLCVLTHLPTEEAAEALAELDEEVAGDVLENMDADDAARLIAEMDPDDAVDILDEVEEGHRDILLSNLPADDAEELRMLLSFDPDTAAGVMNTDIIMKIRKLS